MGWKLAAQSKRIVCASASHIVTPEPRTIIIDMNAVCRRDFAWNTNTITPQQAMAMFWKKHVLKYPECTLFYFAFDSSDRIPQTRKDFLRNVRYAKAKDGPSINPFDADTLNNTWLEIWSSSQKGQMWTLLAHCLHYHARVYGAPDVVYEIDTPAHGILRCPRQQGPERYSNFGEADMKAALFANERATKPVLIKTIDWDMIVQGVAIFPPFVFVDIGSVWRHNGHTFFSKKAAPTNAIRESEFIEPNVVTANERLSHAFMMLATAGVDYCEGLKRFGYREKEMVTLLALIGPPFITKENNVFTFDVEKFKERLRQVTPFRPRSKCLHDLNLEMNKMWYCLLYFAFAGRNSERGGPVPPEATFFLSGETAQAALKSREQCTPVVYIDDAAGV